MHLLSTVFLNINFLISSVISHVVSERFFPLDMTSDFDFVLLCLRFTKLDDTIISDESVKWMIISSKEGLKCEIFH